MRLRGSLALLTSLTRSISFYLVRFRFRNPSYGAAHAKPDVLGSTIYITWSDRQSVIRTSGFDIVDDLPHFLLVLLILQRFDLARWGFFTEFQRSSIHTIRDNHGTRVLRANFGEKQVDIFPEDDLIYGGISLAGRSTVIAGAREARDPPPKPTSSEEIRNGNKLVVKFSWPEETRVSEADFVQRAEKIGKGNPLVKDHIPTMLGNIDPPYRTCSTRLIRKFLDLDTSGARVLRVIVFRRLLEIKCLDEEHMLIAFLDCLFCECLRGLCHVITLTLWQATGLCGRNISSTGTSA